MSNMYSNTQFPGYLSQNQQDLLMAALQSNQLSNTNVETINPTSASLDPTMLSTAQPDGLYEDLDFASFDDSQLFDFIDSTNQPYDAELDQLEAHIDNGVATATETSNGGDNGVEKRKSMAEPASEDDETEPKRREGDEKQAKKPGRKPLTSEPTTKRKAQNRAAQRAFRERKEKHLHDLETKVSELEKTSESTTHENGLLRAQVNTLQSELRDYRKRLSMQSSLGASPRSAGLQSFSTSSDAPVNPFQFDFTQTPYVPYGPLFPNTTIHSSPRSTMLDYKSSEGGYVSRHGSTDATSPRSNIINTPGSTEGNRSQHGSISHDSPNGTVNSPPTDVQAKLRPSSLAHVASDSSSTYNIFTSGNMTESPKPTATSNESTGAPTRIFQFNSGSSASPSTSSGSQYGGNGTSSSCGTSPEPSSGVNKEATGVLDTIDETSKQREFLDSLGQACGDVINPEPRAKSMSSSAMSSGMSMDTLTANSNPFQVFGGGQDLFSASWPDFPESNTAIQGDGSFTGGFLNDGPSIFELSSPMNWNDLTGSMRTGLTPAQQKANPFEAPNVLPPVKEEEVVPGEGQMLSCNKVWDAIRSRPDFGDLDIDNLCVELRKKAKCSETGVVIDKFDVDEALQRLPGM